MRKTYAFKLCDSKKNELLAARIDAASQIYNHCIALHKRYYRMTGKHLNGYRLSGHIAKLRHRPEYSDWTLVGSQAVQDVVERIDRGYGLFFDYVKAKKKGKTSSRRVAPPTFKKRAKYKSFTLKQAGFKFTNDGVVIIHGRKYRYFNSRPIEGELKTLTVKRDTVGDMHIFLSCEIQQPEIKRAMTGKTAGFDFGLKTFLVSSDNTEFQAPLFFKKGIAEIKKGGKALSRKKKGSKNRREAKRQLAQTHIDIANRRRDYHFKLARELCSRYDAMYFEDLDIKGMQQRWGRKVSDIGFSQFMGILGHVANQTGATVTKIDRYFPSSKTCSVCGWVDHDLSIKDRHWTCGGCKTKHDRDKNAAANIHTVGASTAKLDGIRPAELAIVI